MTVITTGDAVKSTVTGRNSTGRAATGGDEKIPRFLIDCY